MGGLGLVFALGLGAASAFVPARQPAPRAQSRLGVSHVRATPAPVQRAHVAAIDAGTADALFGLAFVTLFSLSGILFIKSAFYESQSESSILEGDPFTAIGLRLPFSAPRMSEAEALAKAESLSAQLRDAIAEREYPTALKMKRELANLMIDYRIDYNAGDDDLFDGTDDVEPEKPPSGLPGVPSFLQNPGTGLDRR